MITKLTGQQKATISSTIREDKRLTPTAFKVANALLFKFFNKDARAWPSYATLADAAACSIRSAKSAVRQLVEFGYIEKTRRWINRWSSHCLSNIYTIPSKYLAIPISAKYAQESSTNIKAKTAASFPQSEIQPLGAIPEGLAKVLVRFGNAVADRFGLPPSPTAT